MHSEVNMKIMLSGSFGFQGFFCYPPVQQHVFKPGEGDISIKDESDIQYDSSPHNVKECPRCHNAALDLTVS